MPSSKRRQLNVLVVDDSAVVREVMQRILAPDEFSVTTAADALIATQKLRAARPDVIVLDLALPRVDGLSFLRTLMAEDPMPVVVCSALAETGSADVAMRALADGAVDVVAKPRLGVRGFLEESATTLADTLRAAAQATTHRRPGKRTSRRPPAPAKLPMGSTSLSRGVPVKQSLVAIGASTGGTEALGALLQALPADAPGMVIVQHMPEGFTAAFARRLDGVSPMHVKEAADGDRVERGLVLIAPGGRHTMVAARGGGWHIRVADGPLLSRHRPSVDVLFQSVAEAAADAAVGVLLTGMGRDGAQGLAAMKRKGAWTIAQDEASCVVFGMPKEAIALGAVDEVVSLPRLASAIVARTMVSAQPVAS